MNKLTEQELQTMKELQESMTTHMELDNAAREGILTRDKAAIAFANESVVRMAALAGEWITLYARYVATTMPEDSVGSAKHRSRMRSLTTIAGNAMMLSFKETKHPVC